MSFHSLPLVINEIRATEAVLNRIYDAAKIGLKGDNLALASGMTPTAYRQLCEMDQVALLAEQKGRADGERLASTQLHKAAEQGDAKAALSILQNVHGWVAKQSITVDVDQRISIIGALAEAERRAADVVDVIAHEPSKPLESRLAPSRIYHGRTS
jgi:N-acetylglutamate synthase-like GNAT family acetyltransferase